MQELKNLLEHKNSWQRAFGKKPYTVLTQAGRKDILDMIECDLSPENLTCDGEAPRSEVKRRYNELTNAKNQLLKLAGPLTVQHSIVERGIQ